MIYNNNNLSRHNMKRKLTTTLLTVAAVVGSSAQPTPASQMEKLDRGLVVVPSGTTRTLSWRLLGTDDGSRPPFNILRDGELCVAEQQPAPRPGHPGGHDAESAVELLHLAGRCGLCTAADDGSDCQ